MNKYRILFTVFLYFSSAVIAGPVLYAPTGEKNKVVVIDLETNTIMARIDELENAHGLATSSNSEYLVAGSMMLLPSKTSAAGPDKPAVVNETEHAAHHTDAAISTPSLSEQSYLSIIHAQQKKIIRRVPVRGLTHHTAVSPDGKYAIAVHSGEGGISVVNLNKMLVITTLDTGQWPNYAVFSPSGKHLYISNAGTNTISDIDTQNWQIARKLNAGKGPEHLVLSIDGRTLYSANKGDASVSAIDLVSGAINKTYAVGKEPHGIDISDDGRWLFVASKKEGVITRIDLSSEARQIAELSPAPYHLAYIKGLNKIYVSSRKASKIWVIDAVTLAVKDTIFLEQGIAHQMVIRNE